MPLFKSDEDLFRESTMTFGEHLEDLRSCLFRAIAGLMVGFILGLIFGISLVHLIQTPLHRALKEYYQRQTEEEKTSELQAAGSSGKENAVAASEFKEFLAKNNLLAEDVLRRSGRHRPCDVRPRAATGPGDQALRQNGSGRLDQDLALP